MRVILASGSPRRRELLGVLFQEFEILSADIDETPLDGEDPEVYARRLASEKAIAVAARLDAANTTITTNETNRLIIAADTVVALEGEILGKPVDAAEARSMLRRLAEHSHTVFTGFALLKGDDDAPIVDAARTTVHFDSVPDAAIARYVDSGLPMDRAGGYGIQDPFGARYIRGIEGDYNNVVGLPVHALGRALADHGLLPE